MAYFPEEKVAISFTGNALAYGMNDLLIGILSIYFGQDYELPDFDVEPVALGEGAMQRYTSSYRSEALPLKIQVMVKEGELHAQATGQPDFPLTATSETTLRFAPAGIVMEFSEALNEEGQYEGFQLKQGGGVFEYVRE